MGAPELVVLADDAGRAIGTALKSEVHTTETPLHLAFSCYAVDEDGRTLITRRALSKKAWPGVWTNTCCGHPAPGESVEDAVARRLREELGLEIESLEPVLPDFRYRAVDSSGIVENEICPVFVARVRSDPRPNPDEVMEWAWVPLDALAAVAQSAPMTLSPWAVLQLDAFPGSLVPKGDLDATEATVRAT